MLTGRSGRCAQGARVVGSGATNTNMGETTYTTGAYRCRVQLHRRARRTALPSHTSRAEGFSPAISGWPRRMGLEETPAPGSLPLAGSLGSANRVFAGRRKRLRDAAELGIRQIGKKMCSEK